MISWRRKIYRRWPTPAMPHRQPVYEGSERGKSPCIGSYFIPCIILVDAEKKSTAEPPDTHYKMLEMLAQSGFKSPVKDMHVCKGIDGVIDYCLQYEARRDDLPYEIDGMVVKVNNLELQEQMGQTSHHPRWAIAYKFKARQATSVLRTIEFNVGRTGSVTPVAK